MQAGENMDTQKTTNTSVFHTLQESSGTFLTGKVLMLLLVVLLAGIAGGYMLSHQNASVTTSGNSAMTGGSTPQKGAVYGSTDTSTFKDTATGVVQAGGIDGEGQYHLVRPGGDSQNVYMTSSLVDLSKFVNKKVQVWGQTQAAQHAGWLMDIGRVEVLQ